MNPDMSSPNRRHAGSGPAVVNALLGIWFFVSPWVFGDAGSPGARNAWIIGALITILAAIRFANPEIRAISWLTALIGAWAFFSPWIFSYTANTGRFVNSLCVGIAVFLMALSSMSTRGMTPAHSR